MDQFTNIMPHDQGEEVRKRVLERDGDDYEDLPRKRSRANTTDLLALKESSETKDPPGAEANLNAYDRARLEKGLRYILGASERNITPRTVEFLRQYKDAYKCALEAPDDSSIAVVQALDKVYHSSSFYLRPLGEKEYDSKMAYIKLRRLEMLANYGDYLGQELPEFRAKLKQEAKVGSANDQEMQEAAQNLKGPSTWVEIAEALRGIDAEELTKNVKTACGVLGLDAQHMLWVIKEWAERYTFFHNSSREHIKACHWSSLASQLGRDFKELLVVEVDPETIRKYELALISIRDEYFNVLDPDDHEFWVPNQKAVELSTAAKASKNKGLKSGPSSSKP